MIRFSLVGRHLLLAFVAAVSLWVFLELTQNPDGRRDFEDMPVQIINLDSEYIVVDENGIEQAEVPSVRLEIYSDENSLNRIRQSDLTVTADVQKAGLGLQQVSVVVVLNRSDVGYVKIVANPAVIDVRIDERRSVVLPVAIRSQRSELTDITTEEPQIEFVNGGVRTVTISGPATVVDKVRDAYVDVMVRPVSASYRTVSEVMIRDAAGNPMTGVDIEPASVDLQVNIRSKIGIKEVVVLPRVTGYVSPGYRIVELVVDPQTVSVSGGSDIVEGTDSIQTLPVDVSGLSSSITRTVALQVDPNISLLDNPSALVNVGIRVAPIEQSLRVQLPVVIVLTDVPENQIFDVSPRSIVLDMVLSGSALQRQLQGEFAAEVSVGDWNADSPFRNITIRVPSDVRVLSEIPLAQLRERYGLQDPTLTPVVGEDVVPAEPGGDDDTDGN